MSSPNFAIIIILLYKKDLITQVWGVTNNQLITILFLTERDIRINKRGQYEFSFLVTWELSRRTNIEDYEFD